jgi:hypothetical protein
MPAYKNRWIAVTGIGLALSSFLFFFLAYPYHLFFKEQGQLFLYTSGYFLSYFSKPGWLAAYIGDFLTQFFYLKGGGPLVLSFLLTLEWISVAVIFKKILKLSSAWVWALFPVGTDWVLHLSLLHDLSVSAGLLLVLGLGVGSISVKNRILSFVFATLISFVCYWLVGSAAFVFPALVIINDISDKKYSFIKWGLIAALVFATPIVLRKYYLLSTGQAFIYPAAEPQSILLPAGLVVTLLAALILKPFFNKFPKLSDWFLPTAFIFFMGLGIRLNAGFDQEKILALDSETYFGNPDKVLDLAQKYNLKNRFASYFTNIALARQGLLPEKLLDFYQPGLYGLMLPVSPEESWESILFSNEVYFLVGDMNLAQHSAMLGNTFSPHNRSSRMIRRLAEINLVNADSAAARKYLRMLDKTLFHKKWAEKYLRINPLDSSVVWLNMKREQIPVGDTIYFPNDFETSLRILVGQNPRNRVALDYLLCFYLLNKDLDSFKNSFDRYGGIYRQHVPKVYAEAMLVTLFSQNAGPETIRSYGIPTNIQDDFASYTELVARKPENFSALPERFGKTYWFYFHFAKIRGK